MHRILSAAAIAALAMSAVATTDTPDLPDPVDVEMFFHGDGERLVDDDAADPLAANYRTMDREAPTTSDFESRHLISYGIGPNTTCSGNYLFPVWTGFVGNGTIVGDATVTFDAIASGGTAVVEIYSGISGQACNEAYVDPVATAEVTLPSGFGRVEAVVDLDGFDPDFDLMVQIRPGDGPVATDPAAQGRILYDGVNVPASISFTCQPDAVTVDGDGEPSHEPTCLPF